MAEYLRIEKGVPLYGRNRETSTLLKMLKAMEVDDSLVVTIPQKNLGGYLKRAAVVVGKRPDQQRQYVSRKVPGDVPNRYRVWRVR